MLNRFISCLLFIFVFLTVCLLPVVDVTLDAAISPSPANAEAPSSTNNSSYVSGDNQIADAQTDGAQEVSAQADPAITLATPTPEPTPEPTPIPTPTPVPVLKGESGDEVMQIQLGLITLGFMTTSPDGVYGNNTEKAVEEAKKYLNEADKQQNGTYLSGEEIAEQTSENTPETDDGNSAEAADTTPTPHPTRAPKYGTGGNDIPHELAAALRDPQSFPIIEQTVERGDTGDSVLRLQRRLNNLKYIYQGIDGKAGNTTVEAISNFQRVNGLSQTGIADTATLKKLYSTAAIENDQPLHPYKLYVDRRDQRVYIYQWNDSTEAYDIRYKSFICSTGKKGSETPAGTYYQDTGPAARWHYFKEFNCWAQYAYSIQGNVLFHSVLYKKQDEKTLTKSSVRNLGTPASHGCVRLKVEDAKWIWDNCPVGTTVVVE